MIPAPEHKPAELTAIVDAKVSSLMEHFDSVQILVSYITPKGTHIITRGGGNWYARQGMAHEFIASDRAATEAQELARVLNRQSDSE